MQPASSRTIRLAACTFVSFKAKLERTPQTIRQTPQLYQWSKKMGAIAASAAPI